MAAQPGVHPSEDALRAFALGKLDQTASSALVNHLDDCPACCKVVADLSGDDFLHRLRQAQGRSFTPAPGKALARAAEMPPPASQTPMPHLPPELAANQQYEVVRELGHGGMGVVYLAKNKLLDRLEVLKVINKTLLDKPGSVERFLREIRSAAKLNHTNIVTAYSAVQQGDLLAFAMEYIDGQDLASAVKAQGPLPVAHGCYYVQQAALGLQHAFEKGMVHRDIKPQNLILAREGKKHLVKVLDFGLAKATREKHEDTGLTGEGQMLGTPDYIAPEQSLDAAKADIRADIYSLGCTLYYLLSGRPPFSATSLGAILMAHQMQEAKPLNVVRSEVPEELVAVVRKMMAKSPAKRYQTPLEVVQALAPFIKPGATAKASQELSSGSMESKPAIKMAALVDPQPVPAAKEAKQQPEPTPVWESLTDGRIGSVGPRKSRAVRRTRAATIRERTSPKKWLIGGGIGVGVLLLALVGMLAGGVFKVKTQYGTIVLENVPFGAEILVDGQPVRLKAGSGDAITIMAGKNHQLKVRKPGFTTFVQAVEIDAGERKTIRVSLQPEPRRIKNAPKAGDAKQANGLLAEFFEGENFERKLKTRVDAQVDWRWGGAPDPDVPAGHFSARWTGWLRAPRPDRYKLIIVADDGVRLWLNDRLLINEWHGALPNHYTVEVELTEKPYALKLEYYEIVSIAFISLRWEQQDGFREQGIPANALFHVKADVKDDRPQPLAKPSPIILQDKTWTWNPRQNFAKYADHVFEVGMGNASTGIGDAGVEIENVRKLRLSVDASPSFTSYDHNSFAGFVVDYLTQGGYTHRVALSIGFYDEKHSDTTPHWGKHATPDRWVDLGREKEYNLDLKKWAPKGWDGRVWFTVSLQNAGTLKSLKAVLSLPGQLKELPIASPPTPLGSRVKTPPPDGRKAASASDDYTVRLWRLT